MVIEAFPDIALADPDGFLAIGGDLEVESLLLAYRQGIFPWPFNQNTLAWFAPPQRAILEFQNFHIPRSLLKQRRRNTFTFAINRNFSAVIKSCAEVVNRGKQSGTWITPDMILGYINLHRAGHAHSFECYSDDRLVGGLYGVCINGMFAAESMFYRQANASKLVLWLLVDYLRFFDFSWLDVQIMNEHLKRCGAIAVERNVFMDLLQTAIKKSINPFDSASVFNACNHLSDSWRFIS